MLRTPRFAPFALAALLLLGFEGSASAQASDPAAEEAADLYKEGVEAYFAADYAVAITKFRKGYGLDPNAMFLYNLSLCFSKLSNFEEAYENARKAETLGGMPDDVTTRNRGRLAAFSTLITAEQLGQAIASPEQTTPVCSTDADCEDGLVCDAVSAMCVAPTSQPDPTTEDAPLFGTPGWLGLGVTAIGVTATTIAVVINAGLSDDINDYNQRVENGDATAADLGASIRKRQNTGRVMLFTGLGAMAVGGGLIVYDLLSSDDDGERATLVPYIEPGGAGFVWRATF